MTSFWGQKTFCVITGASRGFGKGIAVEFSKNVKNGSTFLLLSRNAEHLQSTKAEILKNSGGSGAEVEVHLLGMDLAAPVKEAFFSALQKAGASPSHFEHAIIVHSAGITGNIQERVIEYDKLEELQKYFSIEVSSMLLLNSQFFKIFNTQTKQRSIVSITSETCNEPFKSWGMHCSGKAAKGMLMKCIALEEEGAIQVISYDPVAVDTEMYEEACRETADPEVAAGLREAKVNGCVLPPEERAKKLVEVLGSKKYVKGEYYADL